MMQRSGRLLYIKLHVGYCSGIALSAPIYNEFIPWYFSVLLVIPLVFAILYNGFTVRKSSAALIPFLLMLLIYGFAFFFGQTDFWYPIFKELFTAVCLAGLYFISDEDSQHGFFDAVIPLGVATALLGLIKAVMLDRGYIIGYIFDTCYYYPAGSSLCVNYNNFGLVLLIACLGCLKRGWWFWIPILIASGALLSSRRFLVLMVFIPVVWMLLRDFFTIPRFLVLLVSTLIIVNLVSDPESFERFHFGEEEYTVFYPFERNVIISSNNETRIKINRSTPNVILGTMNDGTLGTASRLSLWAYGVELASLKPKGWSYHKDFSCKFSKCIGYIYPHSSILSAWIFGGFVFGIVSVLFYAWPLYAVFKAGSLIPSSLLLISMPYSLLSGDTVFSVPVFICSMLIALSSMKSDLV